MAAWVTIIAVALNQAEALVGLPYGPPVPNPTGPVSAEAFSIIAARAKAVADKLGVPTPVDCVLSAWSEWSGWQVDTNGATETRKRARTIVTPPANGGLACGPQVESETRAVVVVPPKWTRVKVTANGANARDAPDGAVLGRHSAGDLGTVIAGPSLRTDGINSWNVDFDAGADGWTWEPGLADASSEPPPEVSWDESPILVKIGTPSAHDLNAKVVNPTGAPFTLEVLSPLDPVTDKSFSLDAGFVLHYDGSSFVSGPTSLKVTV